MAYNWEGLCPEVDEYGVIMMRSPRLKKVIDTTLTKTVKKLA